MLKKIDDPYRKIQVNTILDVSTNEKLTQLAREMHMSKSMYLRYMISRIDQKV